MADDQGIMGAFKAPPASTEMFKQLADKTDMFGAGPLGAVNRAIVGTPIDALDFLGRTGETMLRGAAKGAEKIAGFFGEDDGMARRLGRDVYGLGIAATTVAPMAPARPRGKSNKTLVLESQKEKLKSPVAKKQLDENLEYEALEDSFKDIYDDVEMESVRFYGENDAISADSFLDAMQDKYFFLRDKGADKGEAFADAMDGAIKDTGLEIGYLRDSMVKRLDDDYGFGASKAVQRREEAAANQSALRSRANQARMATESLARDRALGIPDELDDMAKASLRREAAIAQQQGLAGAGIPEPLAQKPTLVVIEGGKE